MVAAGAVGAAITTTTTQSGLDTRLDHQQQGPRRLLLAVSGDGASHPLHTEVRQDEGVMVVAPMLLATRGRRERRMMSLGRSRTGKQE